MSKSLKEFEPILKASCDAIKSQFSGVYIAGGKVMTDEQTAPHIYHIMTHSTHQCSKFIRSAPNDDLDTLMKAQNDAMRELQKELIAIKFEIDQA